MVMRRINSNKTTLSQIKILILFSASLFFTVSSAWGQDSKTWSLQAGIGELNMLENSYDDGKNYVTEDQGNVFYLSADYHLRKHFSLTGGLTLEQEGLFTEFADGIGLKTVNMLGLHLGAKYYFFPQKWVFQPFVGASVLTNALQLGHHRGETHVVTKQGYPDCHGMLSYDVSCPAVSLSPRIGVDIHLLSSLSLCLDYDYRIGLWGHNKAKLRFIDGPRTGEIMGIDERNIRSCVSIGLKMDFPAKPVSQKAQNNLWQLLFFWIESKTGNY